MKAKSVCSHFPLPGGGCQGDEQGLQDSPYINDGALLGNEEVHGGEDKEAMQHQTKHHGNSIEAKLLSHGWWITHLQDLPSHQEHNAEWEVPGRTGTSKGHREQWWVQTVMNAFSSSRLCLGLSQGSTNAKQSSIGCTFSKQYSVQYCDRSIKLQVRQD